MTDKTICRRWKSAMLKILLDSAKPGKRRRKLTRTEQWAITQQGRAMQAGTLRLRYEDGKIVAHTAGSLASVLRAAPPAPLGAPRPQLEVIAHTQEEYDLMQAQLARQGVL